jgi:hypothetical protein
VSERGHEADEIRERIEELDVMLHAMRQASETLGLFLKQPEPRGAREPAPCH